MDTKNIEQRSPEWFEARKNKITGSAVGAILGVNPYKKPAEVMREMVRSYHGLPNEFQGNPATYWGTSCEQIAIDQFELFHSEVPVEETGFHVNPVNTWLGASPDGLLGTSGVFEAKCPYGLRNKENPEFKSLADQPHYAAQVQMEMYCSERDWAAFYQWSPNGDKLERVGANYDWIEENLPKLQAFYDSYLIERELPNAQMYLEDAHKVQNDQTITDLVTRHSSISEQIKELDVMKKDLLAEIIERCGERQSSINGHKLTKVERKGSINYKEVPELDGVDLEFYRKSASSYWKLS